MAIEKLPIRTYTHLGQTISDASVSDFKINEIIDYINSQYHIVEHNKMVEQEPKTLRDDLKGLAFRDAEVDQIMDVVKKHQGVEQEPNKVELVPLLPRDIVAITDEIICLSDIGKVDENRIHNILSKYGVPKQKKFTERDIDDFIEKTYGGNMIGKASIMRFLSSNDLFSQ